MSTVLCSCLLGDNAKVRLKLSKMLEEEASGLYPDDLPEGSVSICEVEMKGCRREFYADRRGEEIEIGTPVIVEADGGFDMGVVYSTGRIALRKLQLKGLASEVEKLPAIMRRATEEEVREFTEIRKREPEIREACLNRIERHQLDMKLVDIDLRLDQQKLSVYYTATHRVDFRGLVRDLAGEFKARIQMVQITTREEARRTNTQGSCGCALCCSTWMQKIHSNPFAEKPQMPDSMNGDNFSFNTIGLCNRPKCCLGFSKTNGKNGNCHHGNVRQNGWPSVGTTFTVRDGNAVVEGVDQQKKSIWIRYVSTGQKRRISLDQYNNMAGKRQGGQA
ncbi:MAG: PSP1 domain-containing protein [Chlorobaculum sp.]